MLENTTHVEQTFFASTDDGQSAKVELADQGDAGFFRFNAEDASLSFIEPPDYEEALDENRDNIYELTFVASLEGYSSIEQSLSVSVSDESQIAAGITFPVQHGMLDSLATTISVSGYIRDEEDGLISTQELKQFKVRNKAAPSTVYDINPIDGQSDRWTVTLPVSQLGDSYQLLSTGEVIDTVDASRFVAPGLLRLASHSRTKDLYAYNTTFEYLLKYTDDGFKPIESPVKTLSETGFYIQDLLLGPDKLMILSGRLRDNRMRIDALDLSEGSWKNLVNPNESDIEDSVDLAGMRDVFYDSKTQNLVTLTSDSEVYIFDLVAKVWTLVTELGQELRQPSPQIVGYDDDSGELILLATTDPSGNGRPENPPAGDNIYSISVRGTVAKPQLRCTLPAQSQVLNAFPGNQILLKDETNYFSLFLNDCSQWILAELNYPDGTTYNAEHPSVVTKGGIYFRSGENPDLALSDFVTQTTRTVSTYESAGFGDTAELFLATQFSIDNKKAYTFDLPKENLLTVDLDTGERAIIETTPDESSLWLALGLVLDQDNTSLYTTHSFGSYYVYEHNLKTLEKNLITSKRGYFNPTMNEIGSGPTPFRHIASAVDSNNNTLYQLAWDTGDDSSPALIYTIDMTNGNRTAAKLQQDEQHDSSLQQNIAKMLYHSERQTLYTLQYGTDAIGQYVYLVELEPHTGKQTILEALPSRDRQSSERIALLELSDDNLMIGNEHAVWKFELSTRSLTPLYNVGEVDAVDTTNARGFKWNALEILVVDLISGESAVISRTQNNLW